MVNTRIGTDGTMELFHTQSNSWAKAVALLQISNGFETKIIGEVADHVSEIAQALEQTKQLAQQLQALNTSYGPLLTKIQEQIGAINSPTPSNDLSDASMHGRVKLLSQRLNSSLTVLQEIRDRSVTQLTAIGVRQELERPEGTLAAIRDYVDGLEALQTSANTLLNLINLNTVDLEVLCASLDTQLASLSAKVTTSNSQLGGVNTLLGTTNTLLGTINAFVTAVSKMRPIDIAFAGKSTIITPAASKKLLISNITFAANGILGIQLFEGSDAQGSVALTAVMQVAEHSVEFHPPLELATNKSFAIGASSAIPVKGYVNYREV